MRLIVGDVGGTNARLALAEWHGSTLRLMPPLVYSSASEGEFSPILSRFIGQAHADGVAAAVIGIAGPVRDNRCITTNLPWQLDGDALAAALGLPQVALINDLEAAAWGIEQVPAERCRVLQSGRPVARGNRALIAAGTGLGEAGLVWCETGYRPFATEGGHADFAPTDSEALTLHHWLAERHGGHVSWERLVSGPGLADLYRFLRVQGGAAATPDPLDAPDIAAAVTEAAGRDPLCAAALQRFLRLFGAEAGNLALKLMASGGLYIAGGIAPRMVEQLLDGDFMAALLDKGRMRPLLEAMPVTLLDDPQLALKGAAVYGARSLPDMHSSQD
jgi:glucokinase